MTGNKNSKLKVMISTLKKGTKSVANWFKKRKRWLIGVPILLISLFMVISAFFIIPLIYDVDHTDSIHFSIKFPKYVAKGDEKNIELILTNKLDKAIKDVKSFLNYPEWLPIVFTSKGESSAVDFGDFIANETKTRKINFYLNHSIEGNAIKFVWKVAVGDKKEVFKKGYKIGFCPIPYISAIASWIFYVLTSGLGVIAITFISEKIKRIISSGEKTGGKLVQKPQGGRF